MGNAHTTVYEGFTDVPKFNTSDLQLYHPASSKPYIFADWELLPLSNSYASQCQYRYRYVWGLPAQNAKANGEN